MKKKQTSPAVAELSLPQELPPPINSVARNMVWVYQQEVKSRFPDASPVIEPMRSHTMPDLYTLPEEADVAAELYGRALSIWLDGMRRRVYTEKYTFVEYRTYEEARYAFLGLWRMIERLNSVARVQEVINEWHGRA